MNREQNISCHQSNTASTHLPAHIDWLSSTFACMPISTGAHQWIYKRIQVRGYLEPKSLEKQKEEDRVWSQLLLGGRGHGHCSSSSGEKAGLSIPCLDSVLGLRSKTRANFGWASCRSSKIRISTTCYDLAPSRRFAVRTDPAFIK